MVNEAEDWWELVDLVSIQEEIIHTERDYFLIQLLIYYLSLLVSDQMTQVVASNIGTISFSSSVKCQISKMTFEQKYAR